MTFIYVLPHLTTEQLLQLQTNVSAFLRTKDAGCSLENNIPPSQMLALQEFYNATNGDHWIHFNRQGLVRAKHRWNFTGFDGITDNHYPNPCNGSWQGISCATNWTTNGVKYGCSVIGLDLAYMNLTGHIAPSIVNLPSLVVLELNFNSIGGTIPLSVYSLTELVYLNFYRNQLTGTLATEIGQLRKLLFLGVMKNRLKGTLPSQLGNLSGLYEFYAYTNDFEGTIPTTLALCMNLTTLDLYANRLTGTIPSEFSILSRLFNFKVSSNFLTGTIPEYIGTVVTEIIYMQLGENLLTGSLQDALRNMTSLSLLGVESNFLTGPLFSDFSLLENLDTLSVGNNYLTSTLPSSIASSRKLLYNLLVSSNMFTGTIDASFLNYSTFDKLNVIDISDNGFTGSIPIGLLLGPNRSSVSLAKNCFSGTLSDVVCDAIYIQDLSMDGLSAGNACRKLTFPHLLNTYTSRLLPGTIPPCMFSLPMIHTLGLSGNGFDGSLPSCLSNDVFSPTGEIGDENTDCVSPLSPNISTVVLSHNQLTGTLPKWFQTHPFLELDISYNKISGTTNFMENFFTDLGPHQSPTLVLEVNRLSGYFPNSFYSAENITILDGNLFGCRSFEHLPKHDPSASSAECGSTQLYVILGIFGLIFGLAIWVLASLFRMIRYSRNNKSIERIRHDSGRLVPMDSFPKNSKEVNEVDMNSQFSGPFDIRANSLGESNMASPINRKYDQRIFSLQMWRAQFNECATVWSEFPMQINSFPVQSLVADTRKFALTMMIWNRQIAGILTFSAFVVFMVTFLILKKQYSYSTHDFEYGWTPSIAYLHGIQSGVVISVEIVILIIAMNHALQSITANLAAGTSIPHDVRDNLPSESSAWPQYLSSIISTVQRISTTADLSQPDARAKAWQTRWKTHFYEFLVILVDVVVMITANALFLYVSFAAKRQAVFVVQFVLAVFKLYWNRSLLPSLIRRLYPFTADNFAMLGSGLRPTRGVGLQTALIIFNNLFAPCIAIFASDKTCFLNVIVNSSPISASFSYQICSYVNGITQICDVYQVINVETAFQPPFIYSYQCSSALLTTYVPIFVIMYSYIIVFVPLTDFIRIYCCRPETLPNRPMLKRFMMAHTRLLLKPIEHSISMMVCIVQSTVRTEGPRDPSLTHRSEVASPDFENLIISPSLSVIRGLGALLDGASIAANNGVEVLRSTQVSKQTSVSQSHTMHGFSSSGTSRSYFKSDMSSSIDIDQIFLDKSMVRHMPELVAAGNLASSFVSSIIVLMTYGTGYPFLTITVTLALIVETFHVQYCVARYWSMIMKIPTTAKVVAQPPAASDGSVFCQVLPEPSTKFKKMLQQHELDLHGKTEDFQPMYLVIDSIDHKISESIPFSPLQLKLVAMLENTFAGIFKIIKQSTPTVLMFTGVFFAFFIFDMVGDAQGSSNSSALYILVAVFPVLLVLFCCLWDYVPVFTRRQSLSISGRELSLNSKMINRGDILFDSKSIISTGGDLSTAGNADQELQTSASSVKISQVLLESRDSLDSVTLNPVLRLSTPADVLEC